MIKLYLIVSFLAQLNGDINYNTTEYHHCYSENQVKEYLINKDQNGLYFFDTYLIECTQGNKCRVKELEYYKKRYFK